MSAWFSARCDELVVTCHAKTYLVIRRALDGYIGQALSERQICVFGIANRGPIVGRYKGRWD
jgi:hypothetical protein